MMVRRIDGLRPCPFCGRIEVVARKADGESVAIAEINWAYVIPCKHCCKFHLDNSDHDYRSGWWCDRWDTDMVEPDGFCAWGELAGDAE